MLAGWAATAVQPEMFKYSLDSLSWNFVHKLCNFGILGNVVAWMNELHVLLPAYSLILQIACKSSQWYHHILMVSQPSYLYASHGQQEQDDAWGWCLRSSGHDRGACRWFRVARSMRVQALSNLLFSNLVRAHDSCLKSTTGLEH